MVIFWVSYDEYLHCFTFLINFIVLYRQKLDEVKRMEIEYQRELLRQKRDHMMGIDRNYWNPIHHDNKDTFEKDDLKKLLSKVCTLYFFIFAKYLYLNCINCLSLIFFYSTMI